MSRRLGASSVGIMSEPGRDIVTRWVDRRSLLVAALGFVLLRNWRSVPELVTLHAWLATSTQTEHCRRGHPFLARENHVASGYASGKGCPSPKPHPPRLTMADAAPIGPGTPGDCRQRGRTQGSQPL